jgi:cytochrome c-type biogenesis protein CcmE
VLAGLTLTTALVLYALRSNIDLFYTPGEILYGKRETQQRPERSASARRRDGRAGSVKRDANSLQVSLASMTPKVGGRQLRRHSAGPVPRRAGRGGAHNRIQAKEVLAKHDENYTPPEVEKAMESNHRRPESAYRDTSMMPEVGNGLLCLALGVALLLPSIRCGARRGDRRMMASSRVFAVLLFILVMGAFLVLINAFVVNDFTLSYVASNANTQLPVRYRGRSLGRT